MLGLRPYKNCDAEKIVSWIGDEIAFRKWCADRYDKYPITADDLNSYYDSMASSDSYFAMTAFDETGPVGHLILRYANTARTVVRLGFIIVDNKRRGTGLGKRMIQLACKYSVEFLGAKKLSLGVFENNEAAYRCYLAAGFREIIPEKPEYFSILGEKWKCLELELIP